MDRIERATHLLQDEFFVSVMAALKETEINAIINSNENDCDLRESSYKTIKVLDTLVSHIQSIADGAKLRDKRWTIL
jgi:hypothetical protein|tara:strand:- start:2783 stop:3013 length:231 start_codon:yes stop_codon:yes gene_type:complete